VGAVCLRVADRGGAGEFDVVTLKNLPGGAADAVGRVRRSRHPAQYDTAISETDARPASGQQSAGGYKPTPAHAAAHNPGTAAARENAPDAPADGSACRWTSSSVRFHPLHTARQSCLSGKYKTARRY